MNKIHAKLIVAATVSVTSLLPAHAAGERELEKALEAASEYRYAQAMTHFRGAAEQGNVDAQRSSGLMALYGDRLYGSAVPRNRTEAVKWLNLAAKGGCEVSSYMLNHLAQHSGEPPLTLSKPAQALPPSGN